MARLQDQLAPVAATLPRHVVVLKPPLDHATVARSSAREWLGVSGQGWMPSWLHLPAGSAATRAGATDALDLRGPTSVRRRWILLVEGAQGPVFRSALSKQL